MEIPIYKTFDEFQQNVWNDFEEWKKVYPDGLKIDYIKEVYLLYRTKKIYFESAVLSVDSHINYEENKYLWKTFNYLFRKINHWYETQIEELDKVDKSDVKPLFSATQTAIFGRLIYDLLFKDNGKPTQRNVSSGLSQIFGFSDQKIKNELTGNNYFSQLKRSDKEKIIEILNKMIDQLKSD